MICPKCQGEKINTRNEIDDVGDVVYTECASEGCGFIIKKESVVERPDGSKHMRPQRVRPDEQPDGVSGIMELEEEILSADELMMKAIRHREETVGKAARDLVRSIIDECMEPHVILEGEHIYVVSEDANVSADVMNLAIKELRAKGYKPTRSAVPGTGTEIKVKWATKKKSGRKSKKPAKNQTQQSQETPDISVKVKPKKGGLQANEEQIRKQQSAAQARRKKMSQRSD